MTRKAKPRLSDLAHAHSEEQPAQLGGIREIDLSALSPTELLGLANGERPAFKTQEKEMNDKQKQVFCTLDEWEVHLPPEYRGKTPAQMLAFCRRHNLNYFRALNERSTPYFKRLDISAFFFAHFGILHPLAYESLLKAGFPEPTEPKSRFQQPKKRKHRGGRERKDLPMRADERTRPNTTLRRTVKKASECDV